MNKSFYKFFAVMLAAVMCFSCFCISVSAVDITLPAGSDNSFTSYQISPDYFIGFKTVTLSGEGISTIVASVPMTYYYNSRTNVNVAIIDHGTQFNYGFTSSGGDRTFYIKGVKILVHCSALDSDGKSFSASFTVGNKSPIYMNSSDYQGESEYIFKYAFVMLYGADGKRYLGLVARENFRYRSAINNPNSSNRFYFFSPNDSTIICLDDLSDDEITEGADTGGGKTDAQHLAENALKCPKCGSYNVTYSPYILGKDIVYDGYIYYIKCNDCGYGHFTSLTGEQLDYINQITTDPESPFSEATMGDPVQGIIDGIGGDNGVADIIGDSFKDENGNFSLSGLLGGFADFFANIGDIIGGMVDSVGSFFQMLYAALPSGFGEVITAMLLIALIVGLIKIFT